jgi:hypothetical protein
VPTAASACCPEKQIGRMLSNSTPTQLQSITLASQSAAVFVFKANMWSIKAAAAVVSRVCFGKPQMGEIIRVVGRNKNTIMSLKLFPRVASLLRGKKGVLCKALEVRSLKGKPFPEYNV